MSDWTVDEHLTAGGHSYFAEFVAGPADAQDVKDAAVLVGALRALGIDCANLAPRRSKLGSSSFVEPGCGSTTVFCLAGAPFFSVGM